MTWHSQGGALSRRVQARQVTLTTSDSASGLPPRGQTESDSVPWRRGAQRHQPSYAIRIAAGSGVRIPRCVSFPITHSDPRTPPPGSKLRFSTQATLQVVAHITVCKMQGGRSQNSYTPWTPIWAPGITLRLRNSQLTEAEISVGDADAKQLTDGLAKGLSQPETRVPRQCRR